MAREPLEQAAAIPFRVRDGVTTICIVTSSSSGKWSVPKGIIDPGFTPQEAALVEAEEEAGLSGTLVGAPVGDYLYRKWGMDLHVVVFLMRVTAIAEQWEEMNLRRRRWASAEEVLKLVAKHPPVKVLERGLRRIETLRKSP